MDTYQFTIAGNPITKKNSMRMVQNQKTGRFFPMPSKAYADYQASAGYTLLLNKPDEPIDYPVNIKCVYYMQKRLRVDLTNLLEATDDILCDYGFIKDDNCNIVVSHDGSRVHHDKDFPRVEILIEPSDEVSW